jgi:hypothetical protein
MRTCAGFRIVDAGILLLLIILLGDAEPAVGADVYSCTSGSWSNPATWCNGIPTPADKVFITHAIYLDTDIFISDSLIIEPGALIDTGLFTIHGSGTFYLGHAAALTTAHPLGIEAYALMGSICTAQRFYHPDATYHFNAAGNQNSGNGLPVIESAKSIIIELQSDTCQFRFTTPSMIHIRAGGKLEIRSGTLVEEENPSLGRHVEGTGDLIMTGGNYLIKSSVSENSIIRFPRLRGNYSYEPKGKATLILAAVSGFQFLRSARTYNNIIFKGEGIKCLANSTPDIRGTVTIQENTIVHAGSFDFGGDSTHLTMTGGRLIITKTGVCPNMAGNYLLSGGTIEFGNNDATRQTVRARSSPLIQYFNIDITGSNVANSSGSIPVWGTFTIHENALFRIASTHFIWGVGSFIMHPNSTLIYGSPNGINLSGTSSADGNIRVQGQRVFPSQASYGFTGSQSQVTGNALPQQIAGLILEKHPGSSVTLTSSLTITGHLNLISGKIINTDHTLLLQNPSPAALIAAAGNDDFTRGFIEGSLSRNINTAGNDYIFPVGRSSGVQTAIICPQSINQNNTIRVRFRNTPPDYYANLPITSDGMVINTLSEEGCWEISSENQDSLHYNLSLFTRDFDNIIMPEAIRILRRSSDNTWEAPGDSISWRLQANDFLFTRHNTTGYALFAIGSNYSSNPLPVEWLGVRAFVSHDNVMVEWTTATESASDYFTLTRAPDGINYDELHRIAAAGYSNQVITYRVTDHHPFPGINYYRITQTDYDGTISLSPACTVVFNPHYFTCSEGRLTFYPCNAFYYRIYTLSGQILLHGTSYQSSPLTLDLSAWKNQFLILHISPDHTFVFRVQ